MTKIYQIHAYCTRPFISWIEIKAGTPEESVTKAKLQDAELFDAAEDCNGGYPWSEFTVYDKNGKQLLHIPDDDARLRDAAPKLRDALRFVAQELAGFKPDYLRQIGLDVTLRQVEKALAIADNTVTGASVPATEDDHE